MSRAGSPARRSLPPTHHSLSGRRPCWPFLGGPCWPSSGGRQTQQAGRFGSLAAQAQAAAARASATAAARGEGPIVYYNIM